MKQYKLICMSFDGEYQTERPVFDSIEAAWSYSNDLGSRWYFYPFHFIVSESGKTIIDAPEPMTHMNGHRVKAVAKHFKNISALPEMQDADIELFAFTV